MGQRMCRKKLKGMLEKISKNMAKNIPDRIPNRMPDRMPDRMSEYISENMFRTNFGKFPKKSVHEQTALRTQKNIALRISTYSMIIFHVIN